jgi:protein-S-isoprenylcysteine O-methyltransferase Ste14
MNDNFFRIIAGVIFLTGAFISVYHRKKADREGGEKISLKEEGLSMTLALRLSGLASWIVIFAYLINPAWVAWSRVDLPDWLRWAGIAMGVAADVLIYWVFHSLGNNVTPTVITRKEHTLVTHGPYRWVRHPLYMTGMIAYLGFALLSENWFIMLMTVVGFVLLNFRLRKEEANLIERFGSEYQEYMQRTGRYLPKISDLTNGVGGGAVVSPSELAQGQEKRMDS